MGLFGMPKSLIVSMMQPRGRSFRSNRHLPFREGLDSGKMGIVRGTSSDLFSGYFREEELFFRHSWRTQPRKNSQRPPRKFGQGAIEGVAGRRRPTMLACGKRVNSCCSSLGIPPNVNMAMLFSALLIHGIQPDRSLSKSILISFGGSSRLVCGQYPPSRSQPSFGWNLGQVLKIPQKILFPLILLFSLIGATVTTG